jgi:gamma-glutamyltranspeptidase
MRLLDGGEDLFPAVCAPRWIMGSQDEGGPRHLLFLEARASELAARFQAAGMEACVISDYDDQAGHYQAIWVDGGRLTAATDPRCDGAALAS